MSFSPQFLFFINFFFYSLNPFPFSCSFCFLTCSQLPLSLFLLSSISVHHNSFTHLLMLTPPQPKLNGQGERSELDLLPRREQQAAPREAERLCCVRAHMCERDTSEVCSPLTAFNSCNITNDTNLCSKLFVTAGYLTVLLQARWNEFAWRQTDALRPRLSGAKAQARWLASARALCSGRSDAWADGRTRDRDKGKPAWRCGT